MILKASQSVWCSETTKLIDSCSNWIGAWFSLKIQQSVASKRGSINRTASKKPKKLWANQLRITLPKSNTTVDSYATNWVFLYDYHTASLVSLRAWLRREAILSLIFEFELFLRRKSKWKDIILSLSLSSLSQIIFLLTLTFWSHYLALSLKVEAVWRKVALLVCY